MLQIIVNLLVIVACSLYFIDKIGLLGLLAEIFKHKTQSKDGIKTRELKKELFERKYYKDIAIEEIVDLLQEWTIVILDIDKCFINHPKNKPNKFLTKEQITYNQIIEMNSKMMIYCSRETISLYSHYMQSIYERSRKQKEHIKLTEKDEPESKGREQLFIVALLISNIKYDYSNDFIDPYDILKIKINDIGLYENEMKELKKKYKKYFREA